MKTIAGYTVFIRVSNKNNGVNKVYKFIIRGESIEDVDNYVIDDFIPNEIMKGNTPIIPYKQNEYTCIEIRKRSKQ